MTHFISRIARAARATLAIGVVAAATHAAGASVGSAGDLPPCNTPTTCTATTTSAANYQVRDQVTQVTSGYQMPSTLQAGDHAHSDYVVRQGVETAFAGRAPPVPSSASEGYYLTAAASAQTEFGVQHAHARSDRGFGGFDIQSAGSAHVEVSTYASGSSAWRDVWSFSNDGHFSAVMHFDGTLSIAGFPSTPAFPGAGPLPGTGAGWAFAFMVWDVVNFSPDEEGVYGPTLVLRAESGNSLPGSFDESLAIDFEYERDARYVITSHLTATGSNGGLANLSNTARLQDVVLSGGGDLTALSGHDYRATTANPSAVPEPATIVLMCGGLFAIWLARRGSTKAALAAPGAALKAASAHGASIAS